MEKFRAFPPYTVPSYVNVDFEDVKTVMKNAGAAVMGSGQVEGEGRALQAAEISLDYTDISGAKKNTLIDRFWPNR